MPQISPMNWIILCLMLLFMFLMTMTSMKSIQPKNYNMPKIKESTKSFKW